MKMNVKKKIHFETKIFDMNIAMNETPDIICINFCQSFLAWYEANWRGTQAELGKALGVSKGQINNLLKSRRCSDESTRRKIAAFIGQPYSKMIGIDNYDAPQVAEQQAVYNPYFYATNKTKDLLHKTRKILESNTHYANALETNIESFYSGLQDLDSLNKRDRRKAHMPDKIPPTGDRRKTVG